MTDKICRNCRWWAKDSRCWFHVKSPEDMGECILAASEGARPSIVGTKHFAMDHELYAAELYTAGDFGCISFDRKKQ